MFRRWVLPILVILAFGGAGLFAMHRGRATVPAIPGVAGPAPGAPEPAPPPAAPAPPPVPASILFGGELRGRLKVPSCMLPGRGGLGHLRDAMTDFTMERPGEGLLLDLGDHACAPGDAGLDEATASVQMLAEIGLGATAVGEGDLLLGLDAWRRLKNERSGRVVTLCANLRDGSGRELAAGTAEFLLGSRRVVVTAILSPSFEAGLRDAGVPIRLLPPVESVRAALARSGKADLVVLLSHAHPEESRALLRELKEVDVAATAHAGVEALAEPEMIDGRPLFAPGAGWRQFVGAEFAGEPADGRPRMKSAVRRPATAAQARSRFPEVPIEFAVAELRQPGRLESSWRAAAARRTGAPGPAYSGPGSCQPCHTEVHSSWAGGAHARSVARLRSAGSDRVPDCLTCHATGLGAPGGWPDGDAPQAAVSCEACHGPAAAHASASDPAGVRLADPMASCVSCHTPEVSAGFDPVEGWKKAGHAK